jgi:hypothetical protein
MTKDSKSTESLRAFYLEMQSIYLNGMPEAGTREDKRSIVNGKLGIDAHLDGLLGILDTLAEDKKECARIHLYKLLWGALKIGEAGAITPGGKKRLNKASTANARAARVSKPAEQALLDAISALRGIEPSKNPWAEANTIFQGVNALLDAAGHKKVLVDVIRRRLKKIIHSPN